MLIQDLKTNFIFLEPHAVNWEMESYRVLVVRKCTKCEEFSYLQHSYSPKQPQGEVIRPVCHACGAPLMSPEAVLPLQPLFYPLEGLMLPVNHGIMARLADASEYCGYVTNAQGKETGIGLLHSKGYEWALGVAFILSGECPPLAVVRGICRTYDPIFLTAEIRSACERTCQMAESRVAHTGNYFRGLCSGKY